MNLLQKRIEYKVSKWLSLAFLVDSEEFNHFLDEMGDVKFFRTGEILTSLEPKTKKEFSTHYDRYLKSLETDVSEKLEPLLMTYDENDVYGLQVGQDKYLIYPKSPVIQIREHQFTLTIDDRIQPMVFGKDSIRWGLIFSYPQIFYDPIEKKIVQVLKDLDSPNTEGFKNLQKWVRENTKPSPFSIKGKKINATFRIGKNSSFQKELRDLKTYQIGVF
jgi:hypothetical protein